MFSSSTTICLFSLSIFILFQLTNGQGSYHNCLGDICDAGRPCCDNLICRENQCSDCPPLGASCITNSECCAGTSCQLSQCHTCYGKGHVCDPKKNNCCGGLKCGRGNKCH
uniref:Uncharacterized protein n=1 Tax=Meloidogyne incognita TaxID=6306 RepID=A0A914MJL0_MELIC